MVMNDMENKNTSSTTNKGLKEIDKQTNPVMYGWRCPVCGRVYSPYVSMCAYCVKYVSKHDYSFVPKI